LQQRRRPSSSSSFLQQKKKTMHPFLYIFYQYNSIFYSHLFDVYLVNHICFLCHNFVSTWDVRIKPKIKMNIIQYLHLS
jgi:hypothetical protein